MANEIKIGADELILWLRKNKKAVNSPNDEVTGLGRKIHDLIVEDLNGKKIVSSQPSYWANLINDKNIEKYKLPKTSAQYEISVDKIGKLYDAINKW